MLFLRALDTMMAIVAGTLVATTAIVTCLAVFFRSVVGASLPWPEELSGNLLIWISFAGAYLAMRRGGHIAFDLLVAKFDDRVQRAILTLVDGIVGASLAVLAWLSYRMITVVGGTELETLPLPQGLFMAAIPIASIAMIAALVANVVARWRNVS